MNQTQKDSETEPHIERMPTTGQRRFLPTGLLTRGDCSHKACVDKVAALTTRNPAA